MKNSAKRRRGKFPKGQPRVNLILRVPPELVETGGKIADSRGISLNALCAGLLVSAVSAEIIEPMLVSRIVRECVEWMRTHGHPDAPVVPPLPVDPAARKIGIKVSGATRKAKRR